jgi:hypothetical protein
VARIPEEEIERLKEGVSLQWLVERAGVGLRRQGKDLVGCCPFHEDRSPSLVVSPHKNLWHCLGACQAGGSVIYWVMRSEGVSFRHAVVLFEDEDHAALAGELFGGVGDEPIEDVLGVDGEIVEPRTRCAPPSYRRRSSAANTSALRLAARQLPLR